jgi:hypothetical protein
MCATCEQFHPFMSTRDVDGNRFDREEVQDIAYDGITLAERGRHEHRSAEEHDMVRLRRGRGTPVS